MTESRSSTAAPDTSCSAQKADEIPRNLWPGGAPLAMGTSPADSPALTAYAPTAPSAGAAVIVCPGGGYQRLAPHEGEPVARRLASLGIMAFVLNYRVAPYQYPAPLLDAARAVRTVRAGAAQWQIDPRKIGILGFSAGGHLAAAASTLYDGGDPLAHDPIDHQSSRPDFSILIYPVISLIDGWAHGGSRRNLLGEHPSEDLKMKLSPDRQITADTPPAFLFHSVDDAAVPVQNSIAYAMALQNAGVGWELHAYERAGRHGVGLATEDPHVGLWPQLCAGWLRQRGLAL